MINDLRTTNSGSEDEQAAIGNDTVEYANPTMSEEEFVVAFNLALDNKNACCVCVPFKYGCYGFILLAMAMNAIIIVTSCTLMGVRPSEGIPILLITLVSTVNFGIGWIGINKANVHMLLVLFANSCIIPVLQIAWFVQLLAMRLQVHAYAYVPVLVDIFFTMFWISYMYEIWQTAKTLRKQQQTPEEAQDGDNEQQALLGKEQKTRSKRKNKRQKKRSQR